ncbi:tyrosine-type recombinase/integrase [Pedobacter namyangjuensis]|uniref:tyrosine-type recombinase/integrase n=1 Tax=Pedobacter namyangjuensis TaxID=600626 RepID=UPI0013B367BB|nr:tyrosine-type recombinase/integrase [Pedobacter namyangjuensis]
MVVPAGIEPATQGFSELRPQVPKVTCGLFLVLNYTWCARIAPIMFTEPKITLTDNLDIRGYITYYYNGKRYREYNAKRLNLSISPNLYKSYKERYKYLKVLSGEYYKALLSGWSPEPTEKIIEAPKITIKTALESIRTEKLSSPLSLSYKRDLNSILDKFLLFIGTEAVEKPVSHLKDISIDKFLNQFSSSATYYMNKRKTLGVYFSEMLRTKLIENNPISDTKRMKKVATLHKIYEPQQLRQILNYLSEFYPNLHICGILAYGCFLRPHQEIRMLKLSHFNEDFSKITLSGAENKSKRIRTVNVPLYVQEVLKKRLVGIEDSQINILSKSKLIYNVSYLNTQWSRAKKKMLQLGLIEKDQTIYSFRHTGAINVYKKTKDIHILQQMLQHSNMIVTLTYLRGLGELSSESLLSYMPEL